jgi:hypothetical protein
LLPSETAAQPHCLYVVLAGHVVIDGGDFTGERLGRVLRAEPGDPGGKAA